MALNGIPVVISGNGLGVPVRPVADNAPSMVVANNGLGLPIVISSDGAPFVVEGYAPVDFDWQPFDLTAGADGFQWVGFSDGSATLPQPAFGSISAQPSAVTELLGLYDDTASDVYLVVFAGDWEYAMAGLVLSIGGTEFTPFEVELINGNTWLRYNGVGDLEDEAVYQIEFLTP